MPKTPLPERYVAFISYRHQKTDTRWARWLQRSIERYRVPKRIRRETGAPRRLGRVFLDDSELGASVDLPGAIQNAIRSSDNLVCVCSPQTPGRPYIEDEINLFASSPEREEHVFALLVEGEPHESFPIALRRVARSVLIRRTEQRGPLPEAEPLAADVRGATRLLAWWQRRQARLRLIAPLVGTTFDQLARREARQLAIRALAVAFLVTATCTLVAWLEVSRREQRNQANAEAERKAQYAYVRQIRLAQDADGLGNRGRMNDLLEQADPARRGWEWRYLSRRATLGIALPVGLETVASVATHPSSSRIATLGRRDGDLHAVMFDRSTTRVVWRKALDDYFDTIAMNSRCEPVLTKGDDALLVLGAQNGEEIFTFSRSEDAGFIVRGGALEYCVTLHWSPERELVSWDLSSGERMAGRALTGDEYPAYLQRISGDGARAMLVEERQYTSHTATVLDTRTLTPAGPDVECDKVHGAAPDLSLVIVERDRAVEIVDTRTGATIETLVRSVSIPAVLPAVFSADSSRLVFLHRDDYSSPMRGVLWKRDTKETVHLSGLSAKSGSASGEHVRFSPTGNLLVTQSIVYDLVRERVSPIVPRFPWAELSSGRVAIAGERGNVEVRDLRTGRLQRTLQIGASDGVHQQPGLLHASIDGLRVLVGTNDRGVLSFDTPMERAGAIVLAKGVAPLGRVAWSSDGSSIYGTSIVGHPRRGGVYIPPSASLRVWSADSLLFEREFDTQQTFTQYLTPGTASEVVICNEFDSLDVFDGSDGHHVRSLALRTFFQEETAMPMDASHGGMPRSRVGLRAFDVAEDGTIAACGLDGSVRLWEPGVVEQKAEVWRPTDRALIDVAFRPHHDEIVCAAPNGMLAGSRSPFLATAWQSLPVPGALICLGFREDGSQLALGFKDGRIALIDASSREVEHLLIGHTASVTQLAFAPGEGAPRLASASRDGTIRIWDAESGLETLALPGHEVPVSSLAFDRGGRDLVSCDQDGQVLVWRGTDI